MKLLLSIFLSFQFGHAYSQWKLDSIIVEDNKSVLIKDLPTMVLCPNGSICNGNDVYNVSSISTTVDFYINEFDVNVIYFEANLIKGGKIHGYFRRIEKNCSDFDYFAWVNDLIWVYFDDTNHLQKKEYYSNGYLVKM